MKSKRLVATVLAALISSSCFVNVAYAKTGVDSSIKLEEKLSQKNIVLNLDGKEIKENSNGEIIINFEDIKDGNGTLKYIGDMSNIKIPKGRIVAWKEIGLSNPDSMSLGEYNGNEEGKITVKKKIWETEIVYIITDQWMEKDGPTIEKVKIKVVTNDENYLDTSSLEREIIKGKKYLDRFEANYYDKEYIKKLGVIVKESEELLKKQGLKKEEINLQVDKLKPIVDNPEKKKLNRVELNKLLEKVQGLNKDDYTKDSYNKVEKQLGVIKKDRFYSQVNLDYTVSELKKAIDSLIDRTELGKSISEAEKIEKGSFCENSWNNFIKSLDEVKKVYNRQRPDYCKSWDDREECKEVTKEDLNKALKKLLDAKGSLASFDKSALKEAIKKIETLEENQYKPESIIGRKEILDSVKLVYNNLNSTEEQVNKAVKDANDWLNKLKRKYVVYYKTAEGERIDLDNGNNIELNLAQSGGRFCLEEEPKLNKGQQVYWVYDYSKSKKVGYTSMDDGVLQLNGVGETTVKLKFTNDIDKNTDPSMLTVNVKVTEIPKIEDIKICVGGKEVQDKIICEGRQDVTLQIKAKFKGKDKYELMDRTKFQYSTLNKIDNAGAMKDTGDKNYIIHLYNYNPLVQGVIKPENPGNTTLVIEFPKDKIRKEVPVEVKDVPVQEIYLNLPEEFEYYELSYAPGAYTGIDIKRETVGIKPSNATPKGPIKLKFSDNSIARHQPLHGNYIEPRKDGTVDITAYLDTHGKHFEVTKKVRFHKKKTPVENIKAVNNKINVKVDEIIPIGIKTVPKDASNQEFDYKLSKDGIVKVIGNSVKGLKEGTVDIEAKSKDLNCKDTVKVTVNVLPKGEVINIEKEVRESVKKATPKIKKDNYQMGNEWDILGLTRNDESLVTKAQREAYVKSIKKCIKEDNKLSINEKPTNIEKVVIGLTSIGENVKNIAGQNLLKNIYNNPKISGGSNESIFALLALDTLNYDVPNDAKWTRDKLIEEIKTYQNSNGGFGLFDSETVSIDMTAMALQALSTYKDREDVKPVIEKALNYLRNNQTEYGGFKDSGKENVESAAQVLVALTSLGLDPLDPANKFGDKNYNLVTNILGYRNKNDEGFKHWKDDAESNPMSTNQAYYALVSYLRFIDHKSKLYDMKNKKQDVVEQKEDKKEFGIENLTSKKEFKLGGNAQVAIKVTNKCKQNKDATLIVGMFDKEGRLINYGACEKSVKFHESDSLKVQLSIPKAGQYSVKAFVWDNLNNMNPISQIINIPVK